MDSNRGFVILDFPRNLEQAKILERKLSGYISEIEKPKSQILLTFKSDNSVKVKIKKTFKYIYKKRYKTK